jgi:hypothetical protein
MLPLKAGFAQRNILMGRCSGESGDQPPKTEGQTLRPYAQTEFPANAA